MSCLSLNIFRVSLLKAWIFASYKFSLTDIYNIYIYKKKGEDIINGRVNAIAMF